MSTKTEQTLEPTVAVRRTHRGVLTRLAKVAEERLESSTVSNEFEYERLQNTYWINRSEREVVGIVG